MYGPLREVLRAYISYRTDVGYVSQFSFIVMWHKPRKLTTYGIGTRHIIFGWYVSTQLGARQSVYSSLQHDTEKSSAISHVFE